MKLPQDKNERIKLFAMIGVVGVLLLYAGGSYAIRPLRNLRAGWRQQIQTLQQDIDTTQRILELVDTSRELNQNIVPRIVQIAEIRNAVLRARLGNYLLEATERIEQRAEQADVPLTAVKETGISAVPWDKGSQDVFALYGVRVETTCGLHDFIRLLRVIEDKNPFLCISAINIASRPGSPGEHGIAFDVQWLIWKNEEELNQIKASMRTPEEGL